MFTLIKIISVIHNSISKEKEISYITVKYSSSILQFVTNHEKAIFKGSNLESNCDLDFISYLYIKEKRGKVSYRVRISFLKPVIVCYITERHTHF